MATIPSRFPPLSQSGGTITGNLTVTGNETVGNSLTVNTGALNLTNGAAVNFGNPATTGSDLYLSGTNQLTTDYNLAVAQSLNVSGSLAGEPSPVNPHALLAWTYDPSMATTGALLTNGTIYLSALYPAVSTNVTKLYYHISTAGAAPVAGQNFVGLYNAAGTRLQTTNVDAGVTTTGLQTVTITSQAVTAGSMYWVAMVFNAGTAPTIVRGTGVTGVGNMVNIGLSAASFRFATNATTQTSLPVSITPASNVTATFAGPWAAMGV